jgi:hypothetical protein
MISWDDQQVCSIGLAAEVEITPESKINRRTFAKTGAAAAAFTLTASQAQRVLGANDRIGGEE